MFRNIFFSISFLVLYLSLGFLSPLQAQHLTNQPQAELIPGVITAKPSEQTQTYPDGTQTIIQEFIVDLKTDETVTIEIERLAADDRLNYQVGDQVVVSKQTDWADVTSYYISDYVRNPSLLLLFGLFIFLVLAISRWHGLRSLVGLVSSFVIIFGFIIPYLDKGIDPLVVAIIGSLFIILITFYLSHGFSAKTTTAVGGTFLSLVATGLLAWLFNDLAKLTGFAAEEVAFLQTIKGSEFNAQGLLMAGIIIGTLGVLDDITISQASIVSELIHANKKLKPWELFKKAMNVGKDHIASLVNTLVLVYTGSALPLLMLFMDNQYSLTTITNFEIIAEEIVRTLVGSIGLVMAVPITTLLAVWWPRLREEALKQKTTGHHHH